MKFSRITAQPAICTGKPCIRDLRFPVSRLLGLLAARQTPEQILAAYPYIEAADIDEVGGKADSEIIERARAEERIVITANLDCPRLLALLKTDRPGVVLFRGGSYSDDEMLTLLDRVLAQSDALDLECSITVVDRHRIRRRRLPLDA